MQIEANEIHVWTTELSLTSAQEKEKLALLSEDEIERAHRFHFPLHKKKFIAARSMLRTLLGIYLNVMPQEIKFAYTDKKKPYLPSQNNLPLQFNLSHSHQLALYAFTLKHEIGADIEKIQSRFNPAVAKRFFTEKENADLFALPVPEQISGFYKIWAGKEAVIKATGKGLSSLLGKFSISPREDNQLVILKDVKWSLVFLPLHIAYQAAIASDQTIQTISYWQYLDETPVLQKIYTL